MHIDQQSFLVEQTRRHEMHTNKLVGLISLGLVLITIVVQLLLIFDYSNMVNAVNHYVFLPINLIIVICYIIAARKHFDAPWIKYLLLGSIILMTSGQFFIFTIYGAHFLILPIVISTRYVNKKFIAQISIVTITLFLLSCVLNLILADDIALIRYFHECNVYDPWSYPRDAFIYLILPIGLTAIFIAAYSIEMTHKGYALFREASDSACHITAVDTELRMAAEIQRSVLPDPSYTTPDGHFTIQAMEEPASEVGGDFYDYYMLNEHTLAVLIADVSDKGAASAMFMMSAKKVIRSATTLCSTMEDAARVVTKLICENNERNMFLTLWAGVIDTRTGIGKYINAGHPFPYIRTQDGTVHPLTNEPDLFLGNFPNCPPKVHPFYMSKGDTLVLFTDGITDATDAEGRMFGTDGVQSALDSCDGSAEDALKQIAQKSSEFQKGQEQFDDMTLLTLQCVSSEQFLYRRFETNADKAGTDEILCGIHDLLEVVSCPDDVRRNAEVVTDEICANISDHAYLGKGGRLLVRAQAAKNYLRLTFTDDGDAFNPLEQADPPLGGEPAHGGLGIFFVKNLTDFLSYRRINNTNELIAEIIWGI